MHTIAIRPASTNHVRYGFTEHGDNPALELDGSNNVLDRTVVVIGGVMITRAQATSSPTDTWSYPNLHNDVVATANGGGTKTGGTFNFDPYGQPSAGYPSNTSSLFSYGWEGAKQRPIEHQGDIATIEMGARQYVPGFGRFLSVDPLEGGCANGFAYVHGDPINQTDVSGRFSFIGRLKCFGSTIANVLPDLYEGIKSRDASKSSDFLVAAGAIALSTGLKLIATGPVGPFIAAAGVAAGDVIGPLLVIGGAEIVALTIAKKTEDCYSARHV